MRLQDFVGTSTKYSMESIAADIDLARQAQTRLVALGLLAPPADGSFGPISSAALKKFQELLNCKERGFIGTETAKKLIETKLENLPPPPLKLGNDLASRIVKYLQAKNYQIFTKPKEYNIVYIEGMNDDGTLNDDEPNEFNDRRIVIEFIDGAPRIAGNWRATTEPGYHYTYNPMNDQGAARIKFGQYKAWQVGIHGMADPHEALEQVNPISVHRDFNKDFKRTGDYVETGLFAINQHWGYDFPENDIYMASAGCLVGRSRDGHREFMRLIKRDWRYVANPFYVFVTTILPGDELVHMFPG